MTIESHSRYNLLHGCTLVVYFSQQGLLKPSAANFSELTPLDKLKHLLAELEKNFPEFWKLDDPNCKLDDKTKGYLNEEGLSLFRQLKAQLVNYTPVDLLNYLETEFKKAF
jgi:hypothetical protein